MQVIRLLWKRIDGRTVIMCQYQDGTVKMKEA